MRQKVRLTTCDQRILVSQYFLPGYAVTGGQDSIINVFSLSSPKDDPDFSLLGHSENVCTLDVTPGGTIVSGSWDRYVSESYLKQFAY